MIAISPLNVLNMLDTFFGLTWGKSSMPNFGLFEVCCERSLVKSLDLRAKHLFFSVMRPDVIIVIDSFLQDILTVFYTLEKPKVQVCGSY